MATRTTEETNTLEQFRVNFNGVVDDIGNVTVSTAGDQLNTVATTVVGAINEIFKGFKLSSQISGDDSYYLQYILFDHLINEHQSHTYKHTYSMLFVLLRHLL